MMLFFFFVSKAADLSIHQIEPVNNVTLTIVFSLKNIPEILFCGDLFKYRCVCS